VGLYFVERGSFDRARLIYEKSLEITLKKALEIILKTMPNNHLCLAFTYTNLGLTYSEKKDFEQARDNYQKALEIYQKCKKPTYLYIAELHKYIGESYISEGLHQNALNHYKILLQMQLSYLSPTFTLKPMPVFGHDYFTLLSITYSEIGTLYRDVDNYADALIYYKLALDSRLAAQRSDKTLLGRKLTACLPTLSSSSTTNYTSTCIADTFKYIITMEPDDTWLILCYLNIATSSHRQGDYQCALTNFEHAIKLCLKTDSPLVAPVYKYMGLACRENGNYKEAHIFYNTTLKTQETTSSTTCPDIPTTYNQHGLVYLDEGDYVKAKEYIEKSYELRKQSSLTDHLDFRASYTNLSLLHLKLANYKLALDYCQKALELCSIANDPLPSISNDLHTMGDILLALNNIDSALTHYIKAYQIRNKIFPNNHPALAISFNAIGNTCISKGEYLKALEYFEKALKVQLNSTLPCDKHPQIGKTWSNIGVVYSVIDNDDQRALECFEKAINIYSKSLPSTHPEFISVMQKIFGINPYMYPQVFSI
ncbi:unnamed protein product, partial [Didymodactylos carnosus]